MRWRAAKCSNAAKGNSILERKPTHFSTSGLSSWMCKTKSWMSLWTSCVISAIAIDGKEHDEIMQLLFKVSPKSVNRENLLNTKYSLNSYLELQKKKKKNLPK